MRRCALMLLAVYWSTLPVALHAQGLELCDDKDWDAWVRLRTDDLGVHVSDPYPNLLPDGLPAAAEERPEDVCPRALDFSLRQDGRVGDGLHAWIMADACKQTTCARPSDFEANKGLHWLSGEYDLNNNLELVGSLLEKFNRRACFQPPGAPPPPSALKVPAGTPIRAAYQYPHLCFPPTKTVHVEITPHPDFRKVLKGLWADDYPENWLSWRTALGESKVCVRGPFVGDTAHALKAEIHPAAQIWWNENRTRPFAAGKEYDADGPYDLFLFQDASGRYGDKHRFVLTDPPPDGGTWRPWSAGPLQASYEIPFFAPEDQTVEFLIEDYRKERDLRRPSEGPRVVVTEAEVQDLEGKTQKIALIMNGVADLKEVRPEIQVLCKCPKTGCSAGPGHLAKPGYLAKLVLNLVTGGPGNWEEGFVALRVTDQRRTASALADVPASTVPSPEPLTPVGVMTWKPLDTAKPVGAFTAGEEQEARQVIDKMFTQAGWPKSEVAHPYPVLRNLARMRLDVQTTMQGAQEREAGALKPSVDWIETACQHVKDDTTCPAPGLQDQSSRQATLDVTAPPAAVTSGAADLKVRRIVVHIGIVPPAAPANIGSRTFPTKRSELWSVWSHGFRAEPAREWRQAAETLCGYYGRRRSGSKDQSIPMRDLHTLVANVVRDGFVSMDELGGLVHDIEGLCARTPAHRPRTTHGWVTSTK